MGKKLHVMLEVFGFLLICRHVVVDTRHIIGFQICQELVKRLTSSEVDTYKKSKPLKTPIPTDIEAHRV